MSDLVERLRWRQGVAITPREKITPPDTLCAEAAEEIVRLRMENSALRQDREATNAAWQAEVERLHGEIEHHKNNAIGAMQAATENGKLKTEVERLTAERDQQHAMVVRYGDEIERLLGILQFAETASRQQREGHQAEIERLRAALRHVCSNSNIADAVYAARAALDAVLSPSKEGK